MNARGKVGIIHLLLLCAAAGAAFWAINYGPIYLDHFEVRQNAQSCWIFARLVSEILLSSLLTELSQPLG